MFFMMVMTRGDYSIERDIMILAFRQDVAYKVELCSVALRAVV
jgi:hypothetical protein